MATTKYTFEEILKWCPTPSELAQPLPGLLYIVVTATPTPAESNSAGQQRRNRPISKVSGAKQSPKVVAPLKESENSFSASRKKREQDESQIIIGDVRQLLNKVTDDNMNLLLAETKNVHCPKIKALMETFNGDEEKQEAFLTQLAKLFVQKAQIDHAFSKWYAQLASEIVLPEFGDILYEVCRDAIPALRYDPDQKHKYLGALLLLVELCRFKLIESSYLEAAADRIFLAVERNMGNVVMATTTEAPIDPSTQIEVCIDLLCKYLTAFFSFEKPVKIVYDRYMSQLQALSQNKDRVKARPRFILGDFFKANK